jgi:hypothetical protein
MESNDCTHRKATSADCHFSLMWIVPDSDVTLGISDIRTSVAVQRFDCSLPKGRIDVAPKQPGTEPLMIQLCDVYHRRMVRHRQTRSCAVAWLLCALLVCITIHSPHCNRCDELYFAGASSQHATTGHPVPVTDDECNGMCSCCLFQGLPPTTPVLDSSHRVTTGIWIAPSSPVLAPHRLIFRPPRIVISF